MMSMEAGEQGWVREIRKSLKEVSSTAEQEQWTKHSIYRVPGCIKDLNSKAYGPQVISFGPFHHAQPHLLPMESHKRRALLHFLKRTGKPLEDFVEAVEGVAGNLQDAYEGLDDKWIRDKDGFVQLMIVDGCFMLEVMRADAGSIKEGEYALNDPIFSRHGMLYTVPYIKRDMLLVENQLPLLVLETLVSVETDKPLNYDMINRLVLKFLSPNARWPIIPSMGGLGLHPLDVFRRSLLQGPPPPAIPRRRRSAAESEGSSEIIRSAMELYEAGIRFKPSHSSSLRNIRFHHGVLSLPQVIVDDATEYMFLNLMAFERLHVNAGHEVTSYVFFMDNIIDSAKDVSLLTTKGIIQNAVGSDKAVAKLFNGLSKDIVLEPESPLDEVQRAVNAYCKQPWNMWRANLLHSYFRSPWAFLSLAAAIFLLIMTVLQTIYTVLPNYQNKNSSSASVSAAPSPF